MMKTSPSLLLLLLSPLTSLAFVPITTTTSFAAHHHRPIIPNNKRPTLTFNKNEVTDACEKVTETTDTVLEKVDSVVLSRVMRLVDHAPILFTLKCLTDKAAMSVSKWSLTTNPSVFTGLTTALPVPTWCFNVWAVAALAQVASVAKSALADGGNELSQADITATAAANFCATRAIGSSNPLLNTGLTAVVSGYALRQNNNGGQASDGGGEVTIHNAALQVVSSFTTVLTVLGLVSAITSRIPILSDCSDTVSLLMGIASYYVMTTRAGNGTVKKAVNAGVIAGILYARIAAGVALDLTVKSVLNNLTLAGTAFVAYEAANRLRKAVFD